MYSSFWTSSVKGSAERFVRSWKSRKELRIYAGRRLTRGMLSRSARVTLISSQTLHPPGIIRVQSFPAILPVILVKLQIFCLKEPWNKFLTNNGYCNEKASSIDKTWVIMQANDKVMEALWFFLKLKSHWMLNSVSLQETSLMTVIWNSGWGLSHTSSQELHRFTGMLGSYPVWTFWWVWHFFKVSCDQCFNHFIYSLAGSLSTHFHIGRNATQAYTFTWSSPAQLLGTSCWKWAAILRELEGEMLCSWEV